MPNHNPTIEQHSAARLPGDMNQIPVASGIAKASSLFGFSRSEIYRLLSAGKIRAVKSGRSTLIITESVIAYISTLPAATFRAPKLQS
jgi:excisionase family DNA binding protein